MVKGIGITLVDDPGQFPVGKGMSQRQSDNLLLNRAGYHLLKGRLSSAMPSVATIEQAPETTPLESVPIAPQTFVGDPGMATLFGQRPLLGQHGPNPFIGFDHRPMRWRFLKDL